MKRILIIYLFLCAAFEALILLLASGTARQNVANWKYYRPDEVLESVTERSPVIPRVGLIIPVAMIIVAVGYWSTKIKSPKIGVHSLGLSVVATAVIATWAIIASVLPAVPKGFLTIDENGNLVRVRMREGHIEIVEKPELKTKPQQGDAGDSLPVGSSQPD